MKIALFSETYFPSINGVASHVKLLREGLEELGHEVLIVTTDASSPKHYVRNGILYCPGRKMKKVYGYGAAMPINTKRYQYLRDFNPDVIHVHTEFGIGLSGVLAAKLMKRPLVYTLHTIYDDYLYYLIPRLLTKAGGSLFHRYIKYLAHRADIIVGPSKKSDEYLRKAGVRKHVEIVPNGVDINRFCPGSVSEQTKQMLRERYNIKPDAYVGCLITRIGREKSIDVLLEYTAKYMEKNERYHLLIVGEGPTRKSLENQARILGIEDRVTFTGKVLNKDVLPYYGISDIFITASLSEINSISMLEAMSMGLPVLQRYDEVNKDQVVNGVNGYTFVDENTMGEKIDYLIKMEKSEIDKLKERVRNSVMKRGSQDVANILLEIYRRAYMEKEAKAKLKKLKKSKKDI